MLSRERMLATAPPATRNKASARIVMDLVKQLSVLVGAYGQLAKN
jgi:hypothetical protein